MLTKEMSSPNTPTSAAGVDQYGVLLHLAEGSLVEEGPGAVVEGAGDDDEVRAGQELAERDVLDTQGGGWRSHEGRLTGGRGFAINHQAPDDSGQRSAAVRG